MSNKDLIKKAIGAAECYEAEIDTDTIAEALRECADALEAQEWRTDMENAPLDKAMKVAFGNSVRIAHHSSATGKWWSEYGHELKEPTAWKPLDTPPNTGQDT